MKIPKNWKFKYYELHNDYIEFVYEDENGQEKIYIEPDNKKQIKLKENDGIKKINGEWYLIKNKEVNNDRN